MAEVSGQFGDHPVAYWVERLTEIGIGVAPVGSIEDGMTADWAVNRGMSVTREHEARGRVRTTGPSVVMGRTPVRVGTPASVPGSDAASVFGERAKELTAAGVLGS